QRLQQQGVAGWWGDLGEPEAHPDGAIHRLSRQELRASGAEVHNAYGHQWAQLLYQSLQQWQPQQRPMIMMRSGFIGSQRYGMIPWTGDVARSWQGLQPQVELSLQMGMLGLGFTHSDLGGFAGGETLDSELYTRWLQYGAFQPIFRPHGQDHLPVEPIFTDAITQARVKRFITLRYQLMPYLYSMVYQNSLTGMPLMRPLFMEEPQRFEQTDAYRFGDAFIVVPITTAGISEVSVDLPAGIYFDWFSGQRYQGGQTVTIPVDLDTIPLLVEAGAFVPMVKPYRNEQAYSSRALTVHYFHDEQQRQGHGIMYEDDGQDPLAIEANRYERLQFSSHYEPSQRHLSLRLERQGAYPNMPARRQLTLQLHHLGAVAKIEAAGQPLAWEQRPNGVEIEVEWGGAPLNIEVTLQDVLAQQTRL
ncbi:MAG: glycoside hydrolase family 31 protein, partial [Ferrimonas sp.]